MLRNILGTGFLLASANLLSKPAIAEMVMECTTVGGRRPAALPLQRIEPIVAALPAPPPPPPVAGLDGMLALSVIYPGVVVLMAMAAYYFLRVMEPQIAHDHPRFVRNAVVLSGLWLVGFFPFLTSAYGGFMFCFTAMACTGAWFLMRYFGQQLKFVERMVIFWSFFFFSLLLAVMVTGRGADIALLFNQPFARLTGFAGDIARGLGPLVLFAVNLLVALRVFRLMGVKVKRPGNPETVRRLKIAALAGGIVVIDILMMETRYAVLALLPLLLWTAPSFAYYGLYRFACSMPAGARSRLSPVLFASLAVFLTVLVCLAYGATAKAMLLATLVLGLLSTTGYGLPLLWRSSQFMIVKATVTLGVAAIFLCGSWLVFTLAQMPQEILALYMGEILLPALLGPKTAAVVLPVCFYTICVVIFSRQARVKYTLATAVVLALLLAYVGAIMAQPALTSGYARLVPADIARAEAKAQSLAAALALDDDSPRVECRKVKKTRRNP